MDETIVNLDLRRTHARACCAWGSFLHFLPRYSRDLNPIEDSWIMLKAHLRRVAGRTIEKRDAGLTVAWATTGFADAQSWVTHSG